MEWFQTVETENAKKARLGKILLDKESTIKEEDKSKLVDPHRMNSPKRHQDHARMGRLANKMAKMK